VGAQRDWEFRRIFRERAQCSDEERDFRPPHVAGAMLGNAMVIAFVALGVGRFALVGTRAWWKRVILVSLGVAVCAASEHARVVVLGALTRGIRTWRRAKHTRSSDDPAGSGGSSCTCWCCGAEPKRYRSRATAGLDRPCLRGPGA